MIAVVKNAVKNLKFMVDSVKVVLAVYAFLCSATAYNAYASYEKDEEIGHIEKQVAAVAQMIRPESYGYKSKVKTVVINNCGTICAKLIHEHATGRKH